MTSHQHSRWCGTHANMAECYTQVCFALPCTVAEQPLVLAAINVSKAALRTDARLKPTLDFLSAHFDSEEMEDFTICAEADSEDGAVSIAGDERPDVEAIAGIIQRLAPSVCRSASPTRIHAPDRTTTPSLAATSRSPQTTFRS